MRDGMAMIPITSKINEKKTEIILTCTNQAKEEKKTNTIGKCEKTTSQFKTYGKCGI